MRLGRRFYMTLVLIILLMGIGYAFAPFFTIGQWALFVLALSVLVDGGYALSRSWHPGFPSVCYSFLQRR